jgi:hypothetical protein
VRLLAKINGSGTRDDAGEENERDGDHGVHEARALSVSSTWALRLRALHRRRRRRPCSSSWRGGEACGGVVQAIDELPELGIMASLTATCRGEEGKQAEGGGAIWEEVH